MAGWLQIDLDEKNLLRAGLIVSVTVGVYSTYKWLTRAHRHSKEDLYESLKYRDEYLVFHYGAPHEMLLWDFGPKMSINFPKQCADLCTRFFSQANCQHSTALDVGCAVGRSTFELSKVFDSATGLDYSDSFIKTCLYLKAQGSMAYEMVLEGDLKQTLVARVDESIDRSRCTFVQGDACKLPDEMGPFGCVLAANLICRLPNPKKFLQRCSSLVAKNGILVITSPYTFMREWTPIEQWIGGYQEGPTEVFGIDGLKRVLAMDFVLIHEEDIPFLIRETRRKYQWTVAHATVWKRR